MRPMANSKPFVLVIVIVPFLGTVLAICSLWQQAIHWSDLVLLVTMYTFTAFGVTVGFHRMLTHRSFQARPPVRFVLLALGCMAGMADPVRWAAIHIEHHAHFPAAARRAPDDPRCDGDPAGAAGERRRGPAPPLPRPRLERRAGLPGRRPKRDARRARR